MSRPCCGESGPKLCRVVTVARPRASTLQPLPSSWRAGAIPEAEDVPDRVFFFAVRLVMERMRDEQIVGIETGQWLQRAGIQKIHGRDLERQRHFLDVLERQLLLGLAVEKAVEPILRALQINRELLR